MIDDDDDCGEIGGMRIRMGDRSTWRKPAPVPICPPQIPHDPGSNPGHRGGKSSKVSEARIISNTIFCDVTSYSLELSVCFLLACSAPFSILKTEIDYSEIYI
jgi:hypothetical protein